MRVVVALGGNALLKRGEPMTAEKDWCTALLAREIDADLYMMATDVDGIYIDWGTADARKIDRATPEVLASYDFAAGSMGSKVAAIGALADIEAIVLGKAGTIIEK